jgi:hypothetical protein
MSTFRKLFNSLNILEDGYNYRHIGRLWTTGFLKNGVFWVVTPCGSCKNRRFGGTWRLLHQGNKNQWTRNNTSRKQQPTYSGKRYQVFLMKEAPGSSETLVLTRAKRLEDTILHSHRRENLKTYELISSYLVYILLGPRGLTRGRNSPIPYNIQWTVSWSSAGMVETIVLLR